MYRQWVRLPDHKALTGEGRRHLLAKRPPKIVLELRSIHVVCLHPVGHSWVLREAARINLIATKEHVRVGKNSSHLSQKLSQEAVGSVRTRVKHLTEQPSLRACSNKSCRDANNPIRNHDLYGGMIALAMH